MSFDGLMVMPQFASPIWIHEHGLTFRAIDSAEEAFAYLRGWRGERAAIYDHALRSMEQTIAGQLPSATARDIFKEFARSEGILAEADAR